MTNPKTPARDALMQAHVALAAQAARDQAALARVRRLHDALDAETDLTSPDDEITRGAAAKKIAAALDGWSAPAAVSVPPPAPRADDRAAVLAEAIAAIEAERDATDVNVAVYPRYDDKERMALGSAIRVLRRLADEAAVSGPCVAGEQQNETPEEAHPPTHTWKVESPRRDKWASWGATYDERDWASERYESAIEHASGRAFRLVRATTTYTVEAEHTPAVEASE